MVVRVCPSSLRAAGFPFRELREATMDKQVGTGASTRKDARRAAEEATRAALGKLHSRRPAFGFAFASADLDLGAVVGEVRRLTECDTVLGSSTAGQFTEAGKLDEGVVVALFASERTQQGADFGENLRSDHGAIAAHFAQASTALKRSARAAGRRHLATVLLTDGLAGTGEDLVASLFEQSTSVGQIVGGAAGDNGRFERTVVAAGTNCASDAAAVLHVFDEKSWGIGVNHGLRPTTKPMRVTASDRNVIATIEGKPAFDAYKRHAAARGIDLTPDKASAYMVANELGVHFLSSLSRVRAPLSVTAAGALVCAAPVPEGSFVSILDGDRASMIDAAKNAAREAREQLGDAPAAGVLVFDCVCRGMILRDQFDQEIAAVQSVFGDVPVAGFLTYGEIARSPGRLEGWHNATAVVAAIPG
jgi:methyl-accepting chemotaxis protein